MSNKPVVTEGMGDVPWRVDHAIWRGPMLDRLSDNRVMVLYRADHVGPGMVRAIESCHDGYSVDLSPDDLEALAGELQAVAAIMRAEKAGEAHLVKSEQTT